MHLNSIRLFQRYAGQHIRPGMRVLEIGPDGFPSTYQKTAGNGVTWHTVDFAHGFAGGTGLTFVQQDPYVLPVPSESYDVVLSAQVIEHVPKPWVWIKEVARVCRRGGTVVTIGPVSWPYHEAPVDCWRIYPEGMKAIYDEGGLTVSLCRCETLEDVGVRWRAAPGSSKQPGMRAQLKRLLGAPRTYAVDTITIGVRDQH